MYFATMALLYHRPGHMIAESGTPARVRPTRSRWLETALFTAMAVGWECCSEQHMKDVADRLADKQHQPGWRQDFEAAAQLQQHFLHGHLDETRLAADRRSTKRAVDQLLKIILEEDTT